MGAFTRFKQYWLDRMMGATMTYQGFVDDFVEEIMRDCTGLTIGPRDGITGLPPNPGDRNGEIYICDDYVTDAGVWIWHRAKWHQLRAPV